MTFFPFVILEACGASARGSDGGAMFWWQIPVLLSADRQTSHEDDKRERGAGRAIKKQPLFREAVLFF